MNRNELSEYFAPNEECCCQSHSNAHKFYVCFVICFCGCEIVVLVNHKFAVSCKRRLCFAELVKQAGHNDCHSIPHCKRRNHNRKHFFWVNREEIPKHF